MASVKISAQTRDFLKRTFRLLSHTQRPIRARNARFTACGYLLLKHNAIGRKKSYVRSLFKGHPPNIGKSPLSQSHLLWFGEHVHTLVEVVRCGQLFPFVGDTRPPLRPLLRRRLAPGDPLLILLFRFLPHLFSRHRGVQCATTTHTTRVKCTTEQHHSSSLERSLKRLQRRGSLCNLRGTMLFQDIGASAADNPAPLAIHGC